MKDNAPAWLLGGSAGARVSYLTAVRHPDVVRGLVLWSVSGGGYGAKRRSSAIRSLSRHTGVKMST